MADKSYRIAFGDKAVEEAFYDDVVSLTVDEGITAATSFRLRLVTAPQDDGSWTHLDDFELFSKVSIQIGFSGGGGLAQALGAAAGAMGGGGNDGLEPVFDGYVTGIDVTLGGEAECGAQLDVCGQDSTVLMGLEEKIATWKNLSDQQIVEKVVGDYGLVVKADPTTPVHKDNDTILVQRSSDLQLVRELARRNGMEFYVETDKKTGKEVAYFRPPQLDGAPQPDLALQFGDASNLRRFTVRLSGQRPLSVRIEQMDVRTNRPRREQAAVSKLTKLGDLDAGPLIHGPLELLMRPKDALAQTLALGPPTSDPAEMHTLAQAARDEASWLITAEGEVTGDAYQRALRPRRLVLVKGAGTAYSGTYYVTRVVHALTGDGGYTQTFEARRNALGVDGRESFGSDAQVLPLSPR